MADSIIKNPINYSGSKNRIMPLIKSVLPTNVHNIVEPFAGTFEVSLNSGILNKFYNDKNPYLYNLICTIKEMNYDELVNFLEADIEYYGLSKSDKEGFLQLRKEFNELGYQYLDADSDWARHLSNVKLLALIYHSFNYQFVFTKDGKFSVPSGQHRSSFNKSLRNKLEIYCNALKDDNLFMYNFDFRDFLNIYCSSMGNDLRDTVFFVDPPYSISDDVYSRNANMKWTEDNDTQLHEWLNKIHDCGGMFIYTNQYRKGDKVNESLLTFSKNYDTLNTSVDFGGCSYQRSNKGNDIEILIKNF